MLSTVFTVVLAATSFDPSACPTPEQIQAQVRKVDAATGSRVSGAADAPSEELSRLRALDARCEWERFRLDQPHYAELLQKKGMEPFDISGCPTPEAIEAQSAKIQEATASLERRKTVTSVIPLGDRLGKIGAPDPAAEQRTLSQMRESQAKCKEHLEHWKQLCAVEASTAKYAKAQAEAAAETAGERRREKALAKSAFAEAGIDLSSCPTESQFAAQRNKIEGVDSSAAGLTSIEKEAMDRQEEKERALYRGLDALEHQCRWQKFMTALPSYQAMLQEKGLASFDPSACPVDRPSDERWDDDARQQWSQCDENMVTWERWRDEAENQALEAKQEELDAKEAAVVTSVLKKLVKEKRAWQVVLSTSACKEARTEQGLLRDIAQEKRESKIAGVISLRTLRSLQDQVVDSRRRSAQIRAQFKANQVSALSCSDKRVTALANCQTERGGGAPSCRKPEAVALNLMWREVESYVDSQLN